MILKGGRQVDFDWLLDIAAGVSWSELQSIILNPDHHKTHHTYPHNKNFCVTNGWANFILSKLYFWNFLNLLFTKK